jgi:hypothetical protein
MMRVQVEDLRKAHGSNAELDEALTGIYKRMYGTHRARWRYITGARGRRRAV